MGGELTFNKRDGRIMKINWRYKANKSSSFYTITFYDSLLILNSSLDSLSKSFRVETPKGKFPIFFVNGDKFRFDYEGAVPDYKYFPNASSSKFSYTDYLNYCSMFNKDWNLIKELSKYCEHDCIALHQVITKFAELIFKNYEVDITKYPTLSSIAYGVYRSNFMEKDTIINITNTKLHFTLKGAYDIQWYTIEW